MYIILIYKILIDNKLASNKKSYDYKKTIF